MIIKMKLNLALIISIVLGVGLVAILFTYFQILSERAKLNNDLETRISQIANETEPRTVNLVNLSDYKQLVLYVDSISKRYHLDGSAIYFRNDSIISDPGAGLLIGNSLDYITQSIAADTSQGNFFRANGSYVFQFVKPLKKDDISNNAMIIYADAGYINNLIGRIWLRNFARWFVQALIVSFITVLIIRWGIFRPINNIVKWIRAVRIGNPEQLKKIPTALFLEPLHKEIVHIAEAMHEAKATATEEAQLRTNAEAIWTPERLKVEVGNILRNNKMIIVSNREPYMHIHEGKNIKCIVPASGMITAMEPILKACGGTWLASGTGDADKEMVDKNDKLRVPPDQPAYTLRRLWQTKEEEDHFYYGFSNEGLWPLCHIAHTRPVFRKEDWNYYEKVNRDFARAVLEETINEESPFILIQDYHFALLPKMIKNEKPGARIAIFWHIPWPNPESFGICPWQKEILEGMLGADLIGFHTQYHCNHFLETVNKTVESIVLWENFSVKMAGQTTFVKPFPISIAFTLKDYDSVPDETGSSILLAEHGVTAKYMGIGVERIDYTKGIIEKFLAIERFLEKNPSYQGKFTFVQIGAPSRTLLKSYSDTVSSIEKEADRINWRFKSKNWKAILLLKRHHSHEEIRPFYASADFCMVSSLHDGMNLVAKEFVAERNGNNGVLILSRFAGASQELSGALIINPYDTERSADTIKQALEMKKDEQYRRMKQMRKVVVEHNIYSWAANILKTMSNI
jgi:trehalose-6-phosphate synthase